MEVWKGTAFYRAGRPARPLKVQNLCRPMDQESTPRTKTFRVKDRPQREGRLRENAQPSHILANREKVSRNGAEASREMKIRRIECAGRRWVRIRDWSDDARQNKS